MEKNQVLTLEILDMTSDGDGVGKTDTIPLFVKDTVPGDLAEVKVMKLKKTYGFAKLMKIIRPSEKRREKLCPVAKSCGGCQIQEMDYKYQLQMKTEKVRQNLKRIGGFSFEENSFEFEDCIGMENEWRYRNKAQVPFGYNKEGQLVAGFYAGRTHDIIDMEDCLLTPEDVKLVIRKIKAYMNECHLRAYNEETGSGVVRHALIRKGFTTGELMVCLVVNADQIRKPEYLVKSLQKLPGFKTLSLNINKEKTNVILGKETYTLFGPGYIEDYIGDVKFQISPNSFFQVNPVQTSVLYGKALEFAGLTGNENVWDLYCGIGTISLFLAKKAKKVYGVEIVPQAILDAEENAKINGIQNAEFFTGKAEEVLPKWYEKHPDEKIDVISVDPPRKGCDEVCLSTILKMAPEKIVYVSCDSATLARDLRILVDGGYTLKKVQPVDMFPETVHVETCVLLSRGTYRRADARVKI